MRTLWRKNLKFHRLWQIIAFFLHHIAKAHEFSSILALSPPPFNPPLKKALLRRGRWSFFLQLACKKRSSYYYYFFFVHFFLFLAISKKLKQLFHKTFTQDGAYQDPLQCSFWWRFRWLSWLGGHFVENHQMGITLRFTIRIDHMIA